MKHFLLISILTILSTFSIVAQSPCPTITINAPKDLVKIGDSMTFSVKIEGINTENLKYKWIISAGEIVSGQETLSINVATTQDMMGQTVTATIEISGLPQNCVNEFSNSGEIESQVLCGGHPIKLDEYGKVSWRDEKATLDNVAKELNQNKDLFVFFRISIAAKKSAQQFNIKSKRIEKYLTEIHKISKDRIKIGFGGNQANRTEVWLPPIGIELPN